MGNQLFRVHRYFFERESRYFRDRITSPPGSPEADQPSHGRGDSDSSAIVLNPVAAEDFEKFLGIFYNP